MPNDKLSSAKCAAALKVLADQGRLRIIQALLQGPLAVSDLAELLSLEIGIVSHHLKVLRRHDMVTSEREGKNIYYELAPQLLQRSPGRINHLNLGCCRLEIPVAHPS